MLQPALACFFLLGSCSDVSVFGKFPLAASACLQPLSAQRSSGALRSRESTLATARLTYRRARLTAAPSTIPLRTWRVGRWLAILPPWPRPVMCVPAAAPARCPRRIRSPSGRLLFPASRADRTMRTLASFVCEFSSIYLPLITTSRDCLVLRSRTRTKHML